MYYMVNFKHAKDRTSEVVTVRLTIEQRKQIDRLAKREGLSISELIRSWIDEKANPKKRGK